MKKIIILFLIFSHSINAQEIELEYCLQQVTTHYPIFKRKDIEKEINEISKKINHNTWLPQLALNGQASYQSDVTQVSLPQSPIDPLSKDQYKVYVDLNQKIYDGGITKIKNDIQTLSSQIITSNIESEIHNIKQQTQQYFFHALLAQEKIVIYKINQYEIEQRIKVAEASVKFGTLKQSEADILQVELYKIEQQIIQSVFDKKIAVEVINLFTGLSLSAETTFIIPEPVVIASDNFENRPEYKSFRFQKESLDKNYGLKVSDLLPKLNLFGQGGYGRPGLNQLSNTFDTYYIVGARLNWDFSGFYNKKKNKEITQLQKNSIDAQKESLDYNLKSQKISLEQNSNQLTELIEKDKKIIGLRENISKVAASEFDNGVINATSFLIEKNAEIQAKQSLKIHEIQKIEIQYNIKLLTGN
ncbi:TolC family protein [Flavobacterium sp.]|uniref:TolC family protein n=1 Tax=Flavobacterium sp. TaxID=239 RepID=UPI00260ABF82|nr:TolC family protein [Flavobacterium sp.]